MKAPYFSALLSLLTFLANAAPARAADSSWTTVLSQSYADHRASLNGDVESYFIGECKLAPGETTEESNRIEEAYFPLAATKLMRMSSCETNALSKLLTDGYRGRFVTKLANDVAVKLPSLRKLSNDIIQLKSDIDEMGRENNAYDAQMARFGYLDQAEIANRARLTTKLSKYEAALKVRATLYKTLVSSIWRAEDPAMASYLAGVIQSSVSVEEYRREALQPEPSWIHRRVYGNFSIIDNVIKPMIKDTQKLMSKIQSDYHQTAAGKKFLPTYTTRKLLAENMDLLYDPDEPTPRFKRLACSLDQRYSSGQDAIETSLSIALLFGGVGGKLIPAALKMIKLEKLIEGTAIVNRALSAMGVIGAGAMMAMTADSAYQTCERSFAEINKSAEVCTSNSTIEDVTNFESRVLDKSNCALLVLSTAVQQSTIGMAVKSVGGFLGETSTLTSYINSVHKVSGNVMKYKNQGQQVVNTKDSGKDFIDLLAGKKPDDSDDSKTGAKPGDKKDDDSKDDDSKDKTDDKPDPTDKS